MSSKNNKSLAETHPEVAKQWHPTKNGDLTPNEITKGSHKKVWWKCDEGDDHEWFANIGNRSKGAGCPICRGLKVVNSNCLATINPLLSKQWHPKKNGDLTPNDVTSGSVKKYGGNAMKKRITSGVLKLVQGHKVEGALCVRVISLLDLTH